MLRIGKSGDGIAVGVAKRVSDALVGESFSRSFPDIAKFIAQSHVVAVTIPVNVGTRLRFFKMKETACHFAMNSLPLVDHTQSMYRFRV